MRPGGPRRPQAVRDPESAEAAYEDAVKRLARQPQSRAMLAGRLRRAGFVEDAVSSALDRAEADGYLNDPEYAASLVRRRSRSRGHALIAQELRAKGLEQGAMGTALDQIDAEAEYEQALTIGRRLLGRRSIPDAEGLLAYLGPRLARRGFSSGLSYRVCRTLAAEWQAARLFDLKNEPN